MKKNDFPLGFLDVANVSLHAFGEVLSKFAGVRFTQTFLTFKPYSKQLKISVVDKFHVLKYHETLRQSRKLCENMGMPDYSDTEILVSL